MKAEEQLITKEDYEEFLKNGSNKNIELIWKHVLSLLTQESRTEAVIKGYKLKEGEISMGILNLYFDVPNASAQLIKELNSHYTTIMCLLD